MSKSLKNFITIRQALSEHTARQLRLMFLMQSWDKPMNFSDQTVYEAKTKESSFKDFLALAKATLREEWLAGEIGWPNRVADDHVYERISATRTAVHMALCDNFDTATVINELNTLVSDMNRAMHSDSKPAPLLVRMAAGYVSKILRMLGVIEGNDDIGFPVGEGGANLETTITPYLNAAMSFRDQIRQLARENKPSADFLAACDAFRDEAMVQAGVRVEDAANAPSLWKLDDPDTLRRELEAKRERERQAVLQKIRQKLATKTSELEKLRLGLTAPVDMFRSRLDEFSEWDETGLPTKDKGGQDIEKSRKKRLDKELKARQKICDSLEKEAKKAGLGAPADYIARLDSEVAQLQAQLETA